MNESLPGRIRDGDAARRVPGTHDSDLTRRALLEAAEVVFAEHGFRGATAERIATRARANKAMINYHFASKLGLYRAILIQNFLPVAERLEELRSLDLPADVLVRQFLAGFAGLHERHPALSVMILREAMSAESALEDELAQVFARVGGLLRDILERGAREGRFRAVDPYLAHLQVIGSMTVYFATRRFRARLVASGRVPHAQREPTPGEFAEHVADTLIRSLAPERAQPTEP